MNYAVCIATPPHYPHGEAFREVAESLHRTLLALGHDSALTYRSDAPGRQLIVLGANVAARAGLPLPHDAIVYNLEQVDPGSSWFSTEYLALLRQHRVWDYSQQNLERLAALGIRAKHVPVGYEPSLSRIAAQPEDIDVLFYGSINERRRAMLLELQQAGVSVHTAFGLYGAERDAWVARSKVVLNLHAYEAKVFEVVRVSYLLANARCVLSESCAPADEADWSDAVCFAPPSELVARCRALLADAGLRARYGAAGLEAMKRRPLRPILERALEATESFSPLTDAATGARPATALR